MPTEASTTLRVLEEACRAEGLPLTAQRRTIFEVLVDRRDHPTADQIWDAARERLPDLSRTTVYRVLDALVKLGVATKTPHLGTSVRFDPRTERHHHVVCVVCDRVTDVEAPHLDRVRIPDGRDIGFEIDDYSVHMRGVCSECQRRHRRP